MYWPGNKLAFCWHSIPSDPELPPPPFGGFQACTTSLPGIPYTDRRSGHVFGTRSCLGALPYTIAGLLGATRRTRLACLPQAQPLVYQACLSHFVQLQAFATYYNHRYRITRTRQDPGYCLKCRSAASRNTDTTYKRYGSPETSLVNCLRGSPLL